MAKKQDNLRDAEATTSALRALRNALEDVATAVEDIASRDASGAVDRDLRELLHEIKRNSLLSASELTTVVRNRLHTGRINTH